jgi:hypothetical protein
MQLELFMKELKVSSLGSLTLPFLLHEVFGNCSWHVSILDLMEKNVCFQELRFGNDPDLAAASKPISGRSPNQGPSRNALDARRHLLVDFSRQSVAPGGKVTALARGPERAGPESFRRS